MDNRIIKIFADIASLNSYAAEKIVEIANQSINERGRFTIALSGGSTPKALFQMLSGDECKNKIDWISIIEMTTKLYFNL